MIWRRKRWRRCNSFDAVSDSKTDSFGEELRLVGSHAGMGSWDLNKSLTLNWGEGDVWTTRDVELPVDGVFIYKYAVVPAGTLEQVLEWQEGNSQVLTLALTTTRDCGSRTTGAVTPSNAEFTAER